MDNAKPLIVGCQSIHVMVLSLLNCRSVNDWYSWKNNTSLYYEWKAWGGGYFTKFSIGRFGTKCDRHKLIFSVERGGQSDLVQPYNRNQIGLTITKTGVITMEPSYHSYLPTPKTLFPWLFPSTDSEPFDTSPWQSNLALYVANDRPSRPLHSCSPPETNQTPAFLQPTRDHHNPYTPAVCHLSHYLYSHQRLQS